MVLFDVFLAWCFSCVFDFFRNLFFLLFSVRHFSALGAHLEPQGANREVLGGHFDDILGAEPLGENRCFMRRELNSGGLGGSRNDQISRCFSRGVKSAALGGTFADFCDFGGALGIQKGSMFG